MTEDTIKPGKIVWGGRKRLSEIAFGTLQPPTAEGKSGQGDLFLLLGPVKILYTASNSELLGTCYSLQDNTQAQRLAVLIAI